MKNPLKKADELFGQEVSSDKYLDLGIKVKEKEILLDTKLIEDVKKELVKYLYEVDNSLLKKAYMITEKNHEFDKINNYRNTQLVKLQYLRLAYNKYASNPKLQARVVALKSLTEFYL